MAVILVVAACRNNKNFPDEPYLEYRGYELVASEVDPVFPMQHAVVQLYFTDGDGNIGLKELPPGQFNLNVTVFQNSDSGYVYAYNWSGILEDLADEGQQNKVLEGEIFYKIGLADVTSDSVFFQFELLDDDLNSSGIVESEIIHVDF